MSLYSGIQTAFDEKNLLNETMSKRGNLSLLKR